jgi:hypothetical protein
MGLSSSKTKSKTTNEPWGPAQPYIIKGLEQSSQVFDKQQPELEAYAAQQRDTYGKVAPGAEAGIMGAQGVVNDTLAGKNLMGNPFLDKALELTRQNATDSVNGQFEGAGRYGSGMHAKILAKTIADAENAARYNNYAMERGYQVGAVPQAAQLMAGSQGLLNNAAELPWMGVSAMNGNVRQASNGYGTTNSTQTQGMNWGQMLMQAAAAAGQAAAAGSARELKTNIVKVGESTDGLGIYDFDYRQDTGFDLPAERQYHRTMADEVETLRPWAFIPNFLGEYAGVDYAKLGAL